METTLLLTSSNGPPADTRNEDSTECLIKMSIDYSIRTYLLQLFSTEEAILMLTSSDGPQADTRDENSRKWLIRISIYLLL